MKFKFNNSKYNSHKKVAFTLAEVLITLGIIGVVAAMTIPTLISNTNSSKFASQFKKTLSTLNQAALMGQAQYDSNFSTVTEECTSGSDSLKNGDSTLCGLFNETLSGATFIDDLSKVSANGKSYSIDGDDDLEGAVAYSLADGSYVIFPQQDRKCTKSSPCIGFIDVNGASLPNKIVRCEGKEDDGPAYEGACTVPKDSAHMGDQYPIYFYDSVVVPAGSAAKYVLTGGSGAGATDPDAAAKAECEAMGCGSHWDDENKTCIVRNCL